MADKKKKNEKSTTQILSESRNVLYGENVEISSVLNNCLTLLTRMDTRLTNIEKNTGKNTTTLVQMNDKLTSLTARVITAENEIVAVKGRVTDIEANVQGTSNLFDEVSAKTDSLTKDVTELKEKMGTEDSNASMKEDIQKLKEENDRLKGKLLDMQCRSMKNNLIFNGLLEQPDENCEEKLRQFIHNEMKITHRIEFGNVHRFGKKPERPNEPPRPIVARFLFHKDLEAVKKAGINLKGKPFGVNEQFPAEIV